MAVEQLFIINYYSRDCVFSFVLYFPILKKILSPRVKVTTFKKTYQPLPHNSIPSTFRIKGIRKVSRAHNTACMLLSGRKNSQLNHHRMPNCDKFPQRSFLVGLRIFFRIHKYFRIYYILYSDLQTAFTRINSSENIRQSVAKYVHF